MSWPDIDPQILRLLLDGAEELVRSLWRTLGGGDSDADKKAIDVACRKGHEALIKAIHDELERQAQVANLTTQLTELGLTAERVLEAFTKIDSPTVPPLNLDIEVVTDSEGA